MKITANINGSNTEKIITFLADVSTAEIGSVKLDDTTTTKIADGNQYFTYTAQLVDKNVIQ
ncbi:hypothetical protein [Candidatus Arsenophonus triatominarum]|uniref:hypothetical protein n=1 Tax=Candidatus Arsenophonus triatominarum TaxID=57911 RepID=UPI0007C57003|nr:hypothetical protein [Candidatus Arsenophonus triatominarum]